MKCEEPAAEGDLRERLKGSRQECTELFKNWRRKK